MSSVVDQVLVSPVSGPLIGQAEAIFVAEQLIGFFTINTDIKLNFVEHENVVPGEAWYVDHGAKRVWKVKLWKQ